MDYSNSAVTYAMLLIPSLFAVTVMVQGIVKIIKEEADGAVELGFGIFLILLIGGSYWFFIR